MKTLETALGALLHDIGKFSQRAHRGNEGLSPQSLGMQSSICPTDRRSQRSTHRHVLYTNEFVENLPFLPEGLDKSRVANLASYHHRPSAPEQEIITGADRLSSGMERYVADDEDAPAARHFRRVRLQSVASTVFSSQVDDVPPAVLPLEPLAPQKAFPLDRNPADDLTDEYQALWQQFLPVWAENRCPDPMGFVNRAMSVLECYTWCIPSATNAVPDISLFDHLKTTAAIAVCLAEATEQSDEPFLLVAGDLTGIQRYIFDVRQGTGALARRLRARSFQVAAYAESVSLSLLERLGLPLSQRILFAGGKFYLLLPNAPSVQEQINQLECEVGQWLFEKSAGEVGLALASTPLQRDDLQTFSESVARLGALLREARCRVGKNVLIGDGGWAEDRFTLPAMQLGAHEDECRCCHLRKAPRREHHDAEFICDDCLAEEQLGRRLPTARFVVYYAEPTGRHHAPAGSFELLRQGDPPPVRPRLVVDLDGTTRGDAGLPLFGAFRSRHIPHDVASGDVITFADLGKKSVGRDALACLKMDVDNLGYLFSQGLKDVPTGGASAADIASARDRTSISRVAALSRTLETFYSGYLEWLLRGEFSDVYLLYSGGDDVAAVGPWNRVFDLALRVREEFRRFTGGNPAWTLSAGIAVINPRVPVLQAVEEADGLLDASKRVPGDGVQPWPPPVQLTGEPQKDRLTAFGTSIPWTEYPGVLSEAQALLSWLQDGTLRTAQIRRLLAYAEMAREFQRTGDTRHLQYAPLLVRELRRNWQEKTAPQQKARHWAARLSLPESQEMKRVRFICEYALSGNRTTDREE